MLWKINGKTVKKLQFRNSCDYVATAMVLISDRKRLADLPSDRVFSLGARPQVTQKALEIAIGHRLVFAVIERLSKRLSHGNSNWPRPELVVGRQTLSPLTHLLH